MNGHGQDAEGAIAPYFSLLYQAVDHHAARSGSSIAIDEGDRRLSYAELAGTMHRGATLLSSTGVARGDRVAILINNSIEACVAILSTLRADACFVALNTDWPAARIAAILDEAEVAAVFAVRANLSLLGDAVAQMKTRPALLVLLDGEAGELRADPRFPAAARDLKGKAELDASPAAPPPPRNIAEDLAYVLFTSGTTGTPKGVMVQHATIGSTIRWGVDHFAITPADRLSNHSRLSFDVSLFDIFCGFTAGATVCPVIDAGDRSFAGKFIRDRRITLWFSVPSVLGMMIKARQLAAGRFEHLRAILFAGEPLRPEWVAAWREHQPHIPIYNLYGPTEGSIVCTVHNVGIDSPFVADRPVPIGRETRDSELLILDRDADRAAAPGEVGRLMICGAQVAAGYWRRPDLTARAFRINPLKAGTGVRMYDTGDLASKDAAGIIHFVGRADNQVKIQGFRIELEEVELALGACPGVRDAAAYVVDRGGDKLLHAAVAGDGVDEEAIVAALQQRLPKYMVPARIRILEALPHNASGKVDRTRLAQSG
jgi:amino acid adenylation domain-containing protein